MGTKMGPSYANLFVGFIEQQFFDKLDGTKPELYRRYIDDCFGATSCSRHELDYFIASVNSFHPALKYTWVVSECFIALLDINVPVLQDTPLSRSSYPQQQTPRTVGPSAIGTTIVTQQTREKNSTHTHISPT